MIVHFRLLFNSRARYESAERDILRTLGRYPPGYDRYRDDDRYRDGDRYRGGDRYRDSDRYRDDGRYRDGYRDDDRDRY